MKKKYKFLSLLMAASVACTATLAGCSLVSADAQEDMQQVIAEVDISKSGKLEDDLADFGYVMMECRCVEIVGSVESVESYGGLLLHLPVLHKDDRFTSRQRI